MRLRWNATVLFLLLLAPSPAQAGTMHTLFFDSSGNPVPGTITATLDLWFQRRNVDVAPFLLGSLALGIGSDFSVVVPQAVINTHASWVDAIPPGNSPAGDWVFRQPGLVGVGSSPFVTDVDLLTDACSPLPGLFVNGIFAMALRGDCSFAQKVENIEASYAVGALIVNNIANAGAPGMSLGPLNPGIPVIGLSYEIGDLINVLRDTGIVYMDFDARWDPDPVVTPEPATLALFALGLVALGVRRGRPRGLR